MLPTIYIVEITKNTHAIEQNGYITNHQGDGVFISTRPFVFTSFLIACENIIEAKKTWPYAEYKVIEFDKRKEHLA